MRCSIPCTRVGGDHPLLHPDGVRNQSFINNRVAFISSYLKSRWRSASDACIPKPVPPRLSRLILVVETAILPLANLLIHVRFPLETNPEVRSELQELLFCEGWRALQSGSRVSSAAVDDGEGSWVQAWTEPLPTAHEGHLHQLQLLRPPCPS